MPKPSCDNSGALLQAGAVVTPPDTSTLPTATSASLLRVVDPDAYNRSPTEYEVMLVPPLLTAIAVALQVPVVIVPTVAISVPTSFDAAIEPTRSALRIAPVRLSFE